MLPAGKAIAIGVVLCSLCIIGSLSLNITSVTPTTFPTSADRTETIASVTDEDVMPAANVLTPDGSLDDPDDVTSSTQRTRGARVNLQNLGQTTEETSASTSLVEITSSRIKANTTPNSSPMSGTLSPMAPTRKTKTFEENSTRTPVKMRNITLAIFSEIDVVEGYNSAGINPALELAIYDVNKNDSVLPGFYVDYVLMDTKCNEGVAAAALAKMLQQPPQKIMVIGGGCSVSTQATAQTSPFFNLVQISYAAARIKLSRRDIYRTFWRNIPTMLSHFIGYKFIINYFKWKRVATIGYKCEEGLITLHELFKRSGIENIAYHTIDEGGELSDVQMQDLKNRDARIIIFDGYEQTLRKIMCKAYRFGMSGGKIVWMYFGWFNYDWMLINDTSCHADEIKAAAEHALTLKEIMTFEEFTKGRQTVNGQDYSTYERRYKEWPSYAEYGLNEYHAYGYDAIWAAVLAMHSAMPIIAQQNVTEVIDGEVVTRPKRLDDFTYEDSHMLQVFMKELDKTNFTGMTGPMMFYENGSRPWQLEVAQVQGSVQVVVGRYNEITRKIYINDSMLKWLGGKVPPDHTPVVVTTSYVNALLAVVITSLAGVGVLVGLSLLGFNVMFREHRCVREYTKSHSSISIDF